MKKREKLFSKTGAKRVATGAVIGIMTLTSLMGCTGSKAVAAESYVEEEYQEEYFDDTNIISDEQYLERTGIDRAEKRREDGMQIFDAFSGINVEGYEITPTEDIKKAAELSYVYYEYADALGVAFDEEHINTSLSDIINLDVEDLYADYNQAVDYSYVPEYFADNLQYKPAIDAYVGLSGLALATEAEYYIAEEVKRCFKEQGIKVDMVCGILTFEGVKVIVEFDGRVAILTVVGEPTYEMNDLLLAVRYRSLAAINDFLGGDTAKENYTGPLAYAGVNKNTDESMYYSLTDYDMNAQIERATEFVEGIRDGQTLDLELMGDPNPELSEYDVNLLYSLGYQQTDLINAVSGYVNLYSLDYTLALN